MFIDDLKNLKRGGRQKLYWIGYDVRFGDDSIAKAPGNEQLVYDQLREVLNGATAYNLVELAPLLKAQHESKPFRLITDWFNALPPYPRTCFEQLGQGIRTVTMLEMTPVTELVEVRRFYLREEVLKRQPRESGLINTFGFDEDHPMAQGVCIPDAKWMVTVSCAFQFSAEVFILLDSLLAYFVDDKAQMMTSLMNNRSFNLDFLVGEENQQKVYKELMTLSVDHLTYTAMALNLLGCKNISSEESPAGPAIQRKRAKHGKEPLTTFRTLTYAVPGQAPGKQTYKKLIEHAGERRAFHTVPGMTRDYTENGLFGKFKGIFYFKAHTRGTKDAGEIVKDYKVVPSEAAQENS